MSTLVTDQKATGNRAMLALVLGAVSISWSPIFVRLSLVGPVATAFWRLSLALIPLAASLRFDKQRNRGRRRPHQPGDYMAVALPGVFLAADLAFWHISLHMTTVANATLLANMAPIFVTL